MEWKEFLLRDWGAVSRKLLESRRPVGRGWGGLMVWASGDLVSFGKKEKEKGLEGWGKRAQDPPWDLR